MEAHLQKSVRRLPDPAADLLLDGLKQACAPTGK